MKKFIGVLLLLGVYQAKNESVRLLWHKDHGRPLIKRTMTLNRFQLLLRYLRFDDKLQKRRGKLSPFIEFFKIYQRNLSNGIILSLNLTVDEQLVTFHGRCSFKTYMPTKPGRYGIKIWTLCDSETSYCLNQDIYLGKEEDVNVREKNLSSKVVTNLVDTLNINLKGRNVTTDRYFTSLHLAQELLKRDLTCVGTIEKKKKRGSNRV